VKTLHFFPLVGLLLLTACDAPESTSPVGSRPLVLETNAWAGTWRSSDADLVVRVADAAAGRLEIAQIEVKDDAFHMTTSQLLLRQQDGAILFNLVNRDDGRTNYVFGRLMHNDGSIVAWWAKPDAVRQLAKQGMLTLVTEGRGDDEPPLISGGQEALASRLAGSNCWSNLEMDSPFVLIRQRAEP
jgi:hypothetical protein